MHTKLPLHTFDEVACRCGLVAQDMVEARVRERLGRRVREHAPSPRESGAPTCFKLGAARQPDGDTPERHDTRLGRGGLESLESPISPYDGSGGSGGSGDMARRCYEKEQPAMSDGSCPGVRPHANEDEPHGAHAN